MKFFTKSASEDRGAGLVEYAMIVSVIALMAFSAVQLLGHSTDDTFTEVAAAIDGEEGQVSGGSGESGGTVSDGTDDGSGSSGGSGGSDSTSTTAPSAPTTTAPPATTTTTAPTTTTTLAPATTTTTAPAAPTTTAPPATTTTTAGNQNGGSGSGDEGSQDTGGDDADAAPGSQANPTGDTAEFTWWNDTTHGGNGEWKASVTFSNDWIRHQYLKLEVTQVDDKGRRTTTTVDSFYVPAGGSTTFDHWGNVLRDHKGNVSGVMQVEVKVIEVTTSDENWTPKTYAEDRAATLVGAPALP